jgi:glycerol-3-phosphate dehydrogenase
MKRDFFALKNQQFDLLICGGGVYGAWTAYDAALRGLKVAIVEQRDWGSATSSASSKLIHGGLRYLETYDFKLVKKSLKERRILLETAPHRVWPLRFGLPVFKHSRVGRLKLKAGLMLYDSFSDDTDPAMHHHYFNHKDFLEHFPLLTDEALTSGFTYADAQTDDARLVLELISGAVQAGAICVNYCKLTGLLERDEQAYGAIVQDQLTQSEQVIQAKQIAYTTGQWLASEEQSRHWCRLTKGIHLVMPCVLKDEALLLTAKSDGRVFFMIPWYGFTILGTTDTEYNGCLEQVAADAADVSYLLAAANDYLKYPWKEKDIIGHFAGIRVLKQPTQPTSSDTPSSISRDWELKTAHNGVHYAIGGKLTSSRSDAADIVDTVCKQLDIHTSCTTQDQPFPWTPRGDFVEWSVFMQIRAIQLDIDVESAKWLIRRHGKQVFEIFHKIESEPDLAMRIIPSLPFIYADLIHCAKNEMVIHLDDLIRRRLPLLILAKLTENDLRQIATRIADTMNWDEATINQEIEHCCKQWIKG